MEHSAATAPVVRWGDESPFGVVPDWIIEGEINDRAVRLYALLARHAGRPGGETFRSKNEIARRLRCARSSVDRAIQELIEIGALRVEERHHHNGGQAENAYILYANPVQISEGGRPPVAHPQAEGGPPTRAILPGEPSETEPTTEGVAPFKGIMVDRKRATHEESRLALDVLAKWNELAGQNLKSVDWLRKIIMRIREHPLLEDHHYYEIMERVLSDPQPWWRGAPTPSIIFGSGAQFERSLQVQPVGHAAVLARERRYGRGMTTAQILAATRQEQK